ncbi:MAG TPA: DUF6544 family protein, partial [Flavobacterium sp.]|nr:DUF6544 family protein [Flavobacterium sp.]
MRLAFFLITSIHGLIHLLGFLKAFGLSDVKQIALPVSKQFGLIWLIVFVFCAIAAILFAINYRYWWIIGFIASLSSQILIVFFWQDAKFGTIVNVIILIASIIGFSTWNYFNHYQKDVKTALKKTDYSQNSKLTESDIQDLPDPVKRYLRYTGSIGKPKVKNFKI